MIVNSEKLQGCSVSILDLVKYLEGIYKTVYINSGFRTKEFNDSLSNASKNSFHLTGHAVDIQVPDVSIIKVTAKVLDAIQKFPVRGIGINVYENYAHYDFRPSQEIIYWSYNKQGVVA